MAVRSMLPPIARKRSRRGARKPQPLEHRLLLTATLCLLAAGAVMVYSASSAFALEAGGGAGTAYLIKYVVYGSLGLVVMHILSRGGLEFIRRMTPLILAGAILLLLLVKVPPLGVDANGATRWLALGPIQFQPSEIAKIALVLHAAKTIAERPKITRELRLMVGPVLLPVFAVIVLIMIEPDMGSTLVATATIGTILIAAGVPTNQLLKGLAGFLAVGIALALLEPYRRARLTSFLNPWDDAGGAGFQSVQGQIAIGSGGLFGEGLGQSVQKIFYLPEAHTDFILAVIGEELGVVGIFCLLTLYGMIGYAGLRTAKAAKGIYAKILATGLTSLILCQALLNLYAVLGLAPLTGVPLPFISSGSTSLIVLLSAMGMLLNIAGGGSAHLRAVKRPEVKDEDRDRRRRDRGTRRSRDSGSRRATG